MDLTEASSQTTKFCRHFVYLSQDRRKCVGPQVLTVSGLNITEDGLQYNLIGTIHHKPSGIDTGHYTSICQSLRSQSHRWFKYDDHHVSISKFTNMKNDRVLKGHTKSATILFYVSNMPTHKSRTKHMSINKTR